MMLINQSNLSIYSHINIDVEANPSPLVSQGSLSSMLAQAVTCHLLDEARPHVGPPRPPRSLALGPSPLKCLYVKHLLE